MQGQFLAGPNQNQLYWVVTWMSGQLPCKVNFLWTKRWPYKQAPVYSVRTSIARRQRRDREYEVCQTKSPSGRRPNRLRTRVTSKERDESAAASNERLPESQMCFLRTLQSQSVGKGSVHIRLHLTCPFLSHTKDDVRRLTSCYMHGWDGWIDPGGVVLLKE